MSLTKINAIIQNPRKFDSTTAAKYPEIMPLNDAKLFVHNRAKTILENRDEKIIYDDEVKRVYRLLTMYFNQTPEFENEWLQFSDGRKIPYSFRKGVLLIGNSGRSKTFSFQYVFNAFCKAYNQNADYNLITAFDIENVAHTKGFAGLMRLSTEAGKRFVKNDSMYVDVYIDEIGIESKEVKNFGNSMKPIETILHERHELLFSGRRTHATSNYILSDFKRMYSARTYSRLFEMFNIIITSGDDLRIKFL